MEFEAESAFSEVAPSFSLVIHNHRPTRAQAFPELYGLQGQDVSGWAGRGCVFRGRGSGAGWFQIRMFGNDPLFLFAEVVKGFHGEGLACLPFS